MVISSRLELYLGEYVYYAKDDEAEYALISKM